MDSGGFGFTLMTIVGVVVLAVVIAWAALRNRVSGRKAKESETATRQNYEQEDREHRGEADNVP